MQQTFTPAHDTKKNNHANKIIIGKQNGELLNKTQKEFNRLSNRIEKLIRSMEQIRNEMDNCLAYYGNEIAPAEQQMVALQIKLAKLLHPHYTCNKRISPGDKKMLKNFIQELLADICGIGKITPDEELKKVIEAMEGKDYETLRNEEFGEIKQQMSDTFKSMGLDIDLSRFSTEDSEEDIIRKFSEMSAEVKENMGKAAGEKPNKPKNKRQLKQEEKQRQFQETRAKSISAIYKQLAKVLHPDLEQEPQMKTQKENLMKELTRAYQNNDLYTLLRLETDWLRKESSHSDALPEEKMKIYIQLLKEQVKELEFSLQMIDSHPRYSSLDRFRDFFTGEIYLNNLPKEKTKIERIIKSLQFNIANMEADSNQGLKIIIADEREYAEKTSRNPVFNIFNETEF